MVGPALASSFRQQANSNANDTPAAGKGGYGSYGYSHNNHHGDEYSSNRGAYGGAGRRPSEDSSRGAAYGYNNNMDAVPNGQSSSMPYSSSATRLGQQQNYQLQNSSSSSNSNGESMQNSYGNGHGHANGRTSPTSCNAPLVGPPSSSSNNNTGAAAAGGSSTSKNTGNANSAPTGSPEEIENSRRTARIHFDEFRAYLDAEGQRDPNARANAREKLTRLTRPQFQELSTDVYDELMRRHRAQASALSGAAPEFLPQKPDFHPKRNQARQKLSTLPKTRFRDLASDVYFELERRYPEFQEPELLDGEDRDANTYGASQGRGGGVGGVAGYPPSSSSSVPTPAPPSSSQMQLPTRSASRDDGQAGGGPRLQNSTSQKRPQFPQGKPSMDYQNQSSSSSSSAFNAPSSNAAPTTAANEVIIPNKSKVIEEDISLPASTAPSYSATSAQQQQQRGGYGNYSNQNGYSMGRKSSERERPAVNGNTSQDSDRDLPSPSIPEPPRRSNETPRIGGGTNGTLLPTSPDWNASLARASEASSLGTRLIGGYGTSTPSEGGLREWDERDEIEKLKSDYEYKIATMQNRMNGLEKDLRDSQEKNEDQEQHHEDSRKIEFLEHELDKMKQRFEDSQSQIEHLESELSELRNSNRDLQSQASAAAEQAQAQPIASRNSEDQAEIERLEHEVDQFRNKYNFQLDASENLKNEIEGLVDTLKEMNLRQDELVNQREVDLNKITTLTEEVKEWKGRYETAKTELRELKATSQLFVKPTTADNDYMPTSPYGAIMDSHVTRFQSSIDDLLISGRSDAPSSVIIATKQVINAVARIDEDVQEYEAAGNSDNLSPDDKERLYALKSKCNATLSNLTTAARNHATGHGLSPVSLLDAAASHLSNTIIELVRLLLMRKAGTPLASDSSHNNSTVMKPSFSSSSISSRLDNASQSSSNAQQQSSQSRGFPARLASLKREDEGPSAYSNSQPAPGSSGRSSPASFRSRTITASDRTQATSPEPTMRNDSSLNGASNASASFERSQKMNASGSETSLASDFHPDPRRHAMQQQQQHESQSAAHHHANESQTSLRSHESSNHSYRQDQDARSHDPRDRRDDSEERDDYPEGNEVSDKQDMSGDPEAWADLKNYLENQTEAIVHSITALLAAIRGGAQPIKLQENLSQIITIVSSIVQILRDNLPSNLQHESEPTIQELSSNCQKLIELQNSAEGASQTFSKQTKQAMATASFGVAKSLKSINSLLSSI